MSKRRDSRSILSRFRRQNRADERLTAGIRACCDTSWAELHRDGCRRHPKECGQKRAWSTKEQARLAAMRTTTLQADGSRVRPYRCSSCRLWHVGHPPSVSQAEREQEGRP